MPAIPPVTLNIPSVTLNNGVEMPLLGFGVFQIPDAEECERSVLEAIRIGYRLIDTAAAYGNEEAVGRAIQRSGVPRTELFVTTKLWLADAGDGRTRQAFERSLQRLQLDYVDLYLIHQPYGDVYGAWRDRQGLYREGRARAIGISNFPPDRVMDLILHNEVVPAVNQIETHPFQQQVEMQRYLHENQVQIASCGPLPRAGTTCSRTTCCAPWPRGGVAIPKSVRKERIAENFDLFDFELSADDIATIATLDRKTSSFLDHRDPAIVKMLSGAQRRT